MNAGRVARRAAVLTVCTFSGALAATAGAEPAAPAPAPAASGTPAAAPTAGTNATTSTASTASTAPAAGARPSPCASGPFRQFDFWVGEWDVLDPSGKIAGRNRITSEENGCAIVEHWKSANGGTGQSLNFYDPKAGSWKQKWVGFGTVLEMEGGLRDGAMIMQGPLQYIGQDRVTILKGTWTPLPGGDVRQFFEESDDGGKTWKPWFDGRYTPRKAQ